MELKRLILGLISIIALAGCQENEHLNAEYTGNEMVYPLLQASDYPIQGSVTFKEKKDGSALIIVALSGTEQGAEHPVHLHLGNLSAPDAAVAALLNPVIGKTGIGETQLLRLADEQPVTYKELLQFDACIKVHLAASGPDRDIILAGGNIGLAIRDLSSGRLGIVQCQSE